MLKQSLQQKLGLKINPLQIQLIKLLQLPTYQLEQRIKEELEINPLLEECDTKAEENQDNQTSDMENDNNSDESDDNSDDEFTLDDYISDDDDTPEYKLNTSNHSKNDEAHEFTISQDNSFREQMIEQLGLQHLSEEDSKIAEYVIGNIDDDGYLRRDIDNIVDDLAFGVGIYTDNEHLEKILSIIQKFEPAGIGARDLRECLLIQIDNKLENKTRLLDSTQRDKETQRLISARQIIESCFDEFSKKHYEKISKKLKLDDAELRDAIDEILKLNPKPGGTNSGIIFDDFISKIIPDFTLDLVDGELQLSLNIANIPELRINQSYIDMMSQYQNKTNSKDGNDVVSFVKYKLNSAKSFIDAVQQRNETLMLTMTAIIQFQKIFFLSGDENNLKPMILKDIADITGLDVSTISRVSNSKYVQTWFGIYALKDFFSGSMQTSSGEDVSTNELKNVLKRVIDTEDKTKPFTDDELVKLLTDKGYKIARRTIAKYRQMLDIPVARLRREM